MYIYELEKGTKIQITVGVGMQILEFETTIAAVGEQCVYAEPIIREEKMLGFSTKGLVLRVYAVSGEESRVHQFNDVVIRNVRTLENQVYHEITCKTQGKIVNRRKACRVWLGFDGVAQIGTNRQAYEVVVKDISVTGISFICPKEVELEPDMVVHITFEDEVTRVRFNIGAIVVRSEKTDRQRVIYGCRLNHESQAISKYVNEKQREKLRATRSSKAIPLDKRNK